MQSAPAFLREPLRAAFRVALEEAQRGRQERDAWRRERAWELFMLVPRLLLFRGATGERVPKEQLVARAAAFAAGQWLELFEASQEHATAHAPQEIRRHLLLVICEVGRLHAL